jgi:hypothetical protein
MVKALEILSIGLVITSTILALSFCFLICRYGHETEYLDFLLLKMGNGVDKGGIIVDYLFDKGGIIVDYILGKCGIATLWGVGMLMSWQFLLSLLIVEFIVGWIYIREEMKIMVRDTVAEVKQATPEFSAAVRALWGVVSNPFKILGYVLFLVIVQNSSEIGDRFVKALEKSAKI